MADQIEVRVCPFCKEEVKADAILCKHCRSSLPAEKPPHGGICPYCKESIKVDAVLCKHCGSKVGPAPAGGSAGGCEGCAQSADRSYPTATVPRGEVGGGGWPGRPGPTVLGKDIGCTECQLSGAITTRFPGGFAFAGTKICCSVIPVNINGTIIWIKTCWEQECHWTPPEYNP